MSSRQGKQSAGQSWRWRLPVLLAALAGAVIVSTLAVNPRAAVFTAVRRWRPPHRLVARWGFVLVALHTAAGFLLVNYVLAGRVSAGDNLYLIQPVIWSSLGLVSIALLRAGGNAFEAPFVRVMGWAVWAAAFNVAALVGAGVLYGFGYSPYAREPVHMMQNGLYLATLVGGVECARAYLLNRFYPARPFTATVVVSLLMALVLIPVSNFRLLGDTESAFRMTGETLLPAVAYSVVASYLAASGGPAPAFVYHGGIRAFEWFSPVLPALDWTVAAFVETMAPLLALAMLRVARREEDRLEVRPDRVDVSAPWVVASALIVALLWFNAGLFGVRPAIVAGVSMEPTMHTGDLAITRAADPKELGVGDIVRFRGESVTVIHRIIEIEDTAQGRVFVTQGDNNNAADAPILGSQVEGEVVMTIPKLGWVPIGIGKLLDEIR